jgi:hypothetical protein
LGMASQLNYIRYLDDFPATPLTNSWGDTGSAGYSNTDEAPPSTPALKVESTRHSLPRIPAVVGVRARTFE